MIHATVPETAPTVIGCGCIGFSKVTCGFFDPQMEDFCLFAKRSLWKMRKDTKFYKKRQVIFSP